MNISLYKLRTKDMLYLSDNARTKYSHFLTNSTVVAAFTEGLCREDVISLVSFMNLAQLLHNQGK